MQLLPSVGRQLAREEGMSHFETFQLLDPEMNIRLGTRYLRQTLDKFGGVQEYALAAYNAGDNRVVDWQAAGPIQRHGRVCGVDSVYADARVRGGDSAQRGDLSLIGFGCERAGADGNRIAVEVETTHWVERRAQTGWILIPR